MRPTETQQPRQAFTLVELLVVIGIIAILISILLPTLSRIRESGNSIKCRAHLQQIGAALITYANENKDHFPSIDAVGDVASATNTSAAPFRLGIDETDSAGVKETLGLHNLLYRRGYAKHKEIWLCPSAGGRSDSLSKFNSYCWNVTAKTSAYTSLQRGRAPVNTLGMKDPTLWWYVQDNFANLPFATNTPKTGPLPVSSSYWYLPHNYRVPRKVTAATSGRQGSTNVLFYDLSVGYFVYNSSTGTAVQSVVRGE